jgi:hypothetical protein
MSHDAAGLARARRRARTRVRAPFLRPSRHVMPSYTSNPVVNFLDAALAEFDWHPPAAVAQA